ncbi:MAG: hypothetical protein HY834_11155 [Devosia nanyangense]|uniref:SWIM-type domain-containing protein n=1 Tax=Devosia nanyangense TaxID=1228055 RepID=A0A933NZ25_9HYPH|nr:hypothetical protein [Devosia nanyangense]
MIDAVLCASLAAFDDATLATLATPGLVRRAHRDVDEGKLRLVSTSEGKATVEADGQLVIIDTRGPRAADCDCGSVAVCRHRIAAVMFLRSVEDAVAVQENADDGAAEMVAALDVAALERWSGKANWRVALELMTAATEVESSANTIMVSFGDLEEPIRILRGQGFDGIVSRIARTRAKAYHTAAVLVARRHFGVAVPDPTDVVNALPGAIEVDRLFLDRVAASLGDVATLGFNLAPLPLEESLFELSVSSRADSLPRLATMLRSIAAQVRLRRERMLSYDPDQMLELAARSLALTRSLVGGDPERLANLAGKVRRDFASTAPLSLVGCGGERWSSRTGARGVTAWFMEADTGAWLSTTLARGAGQDPSFRPADAWRTQPIWQAEPLAVLAHARIELEGARRSADDRLSAPAEAQASITARSVRPDPAWPGVVQNWRQLRATWLKQIGLGLDATEVPAACLVAPTAIALPFFDDLAQQIVWPVRDAAGEWLALTLDHDESANAAIDALEANARSDWKGMVLVRLTRIGDTLEARPITIFGAGKAIDLTFWQRYEPATHGQEGGVVQNWLARLRGTGGRRFMRSPRGGTHAVLSAAWRQLLDRAETGPAFGQSLHGGAGSSIAVHANRLDSYGLPTLAGLMRQSGSAAGLLAAAYGLLVARQQRCEVSLLL